MVVHACNSSAQEVDAGGPGVKASLGFIVKAYLIKTRHDSKTSGHGDLVSQTLYVLCLYKL